MIITDGGSSRKSIERHETVRGEASFVREKVSLKATKIAHSSLLVAKIVGLHTILMLILENLVVKITYGGKRSATPNTCSSKLVLPRGGCYLLLIRQSHVLRLLLLRRAHDLLLHIVVARKVRWRKLLREGCSVNLLTRQWLIVRLLLREIHRTRIVLVTHHLLLGQLVLLGLLHRAIVGKNTVLLDLNVAVGLLICFSWNQTLILDTYISKGNITYHIDLFLRIDWVLVLKILKLLLTHNSLTNINPIHVTAITVVSEAKV